MVKVTSRQEVIFKIIVEEFIRYAEPIGSNSLMLMLPFKCSSATIRSEMATLEELGLLEKTHTSSGRIPSVAGYQYYVDNLLESKLDDHIKSSLATVFDECCFNNDEIIHRSCDILSQMTNLTAVVLGPDAASQHLQNVQLVPISDYSAVAIFITDKGHTESKMFKFDQKISIADAQVCCKILNEQLNGLPLNEVVEKMEEIKPLLKVRLVHHEMLFQAFVSAFMKFASDSLYLSGKSNMLYQPEYNDIEKLRTMMTLLEDSSLWRKISQDERAISISIGTEELKDMAVISSKVAFSQQEDGHIMIVGPSRMPYNYLVAMLEYISSKLEEVLLNNRENN